MSNEAVNPFDNDSLEFVILVNELQQHSLWPLFKTIPQGWKQVFGPSSRENCLEYVETNWTDIRPQNSPSLSSGS
jgi:MbtH protein